MLIGSLGTNPSETLIEILTFSFKKMRLKVSSAKRRPFYLGLNVLKQTDVIALCNKRTNKLRFSLTAIKISPKILILDSNLKSTNSGFQLRLPWDNKYMFLSSPWHEFDPIEPTWFAYPYHLVVDKKQVIRHYFR